MYVPASSRRHGRNFSLILRFTCSESFSRKRNCIRDFDELKVVQNNKNSVFFRCNLLHLTSGTEMGHITAVKTMAKKFLFAVKFFYLYVQEESRGAHATKNAINFSFNSGSFDIDDGKLRDKCY
jgi:hypothetical protein